MATTHPRQTLRLFWDVAGATPVRRWLAILGPVVATGVGQFLGPFFIAQLLTLIQDGRITWENSWPLVVAYALTQLVGTVIAWRVVLWSLWSMQIVAMERLFQRVFDHLADQSVTFHANRFSGSLVSQTNKLLAAFENLWDTVVWTLMPILTAIAVSTIVLAFVIWPYAVFLFVMSMLFIAAVFWATRHTKQLTAAEAKASANMTGYLSDVITNLSAVKAHGHEPAERLGARRMVSARSEQERRVMRAWLRFSTGYATIVMAINTGAVVAAVLAAQSGSIDIATTYLAVTYTLAVTTQLWALNEVVDQYNQAIGDSAEMVEILQTTPTVRDRGDARLQVSHGEIEFRDVTFSHEDQPGRPLFEHFDLRIAAGEKVGLVGPSGGGKTTLTRILLRFADLDSGAITIDGQNIAEVTQRSLRQQIAYVPQEPLLFHRSLRDNIAYGLPDADERQVRDAAAQAQALDFIEALPDGFDTMVGERGVKLSGGQRQRIAIARAILKDARILVLDEATSALDSESEVHIQRALRAAMAGRTTVVIAHRLSTVQSMDRILVMQEGRIVEQGSHAELLDQGGRYAVLWSHQSGGFLGAG